MSKLKKPADSESLTSKDVQDEVLRTAKSVARTTVVWTLASLATGFLRDIIKGAVSSKKGK
jgi:hypothetical protein